MGIRTLLWRPTCSSQTQPFSDIRGIEPLPSHQDLPRELNTTILVQRYGFGAPTESQTQPRSLEEIRPVSLAEAWCDPRDSNSEYNFRRVE